jgi:hypothetical protein
MQKIEDRATEADLAGEDTAKAPTLASHSSRWVAPPGEGIGLAIVKRLCELLEASGRQAAKTCTEVTNRRNKVIRQARFRKPPMKNFWIKKRAGLDVTVAVLRL